MTSREDATGADIEEAELFKWLASAFGGTSSIEDARRYIARTSAEQHGLERILEVIYGLGGGRRISSVCPGAIPTARRVALHGTDPADLVVLDCYVDGQGRLLGVQAAPMGPTVTLSLCGSLDAPTITQLHQLFDATYADADPAYLDRSLGAFRFVATAAEDDQLVGFSLGDQRALDLPFVGPTPCLLSGLVCIHPDFRRRGLSRQLSALSVRGTDPPPSQPALAAARVAHPTSMRTFNHSLHTVPRRDHSPNDVQRAIGVTIADAFGVADFDAGTFVCRGSGRPIGYPRMSHDVDADEWDLFNRVDRTHGDTLLALTWEGPAPSAWDA